jgi:hypothetical protein
VIGQATSANNFNLPGSASLVVLITDQVRHDVAEKAREAADHHDIPIVAGTFRNFSILENRIIQRQLGRKGFMAESELKVPIKEIVDSRPRSVFMPKVEKNKSIRVDQRSIAIQETLRTIFDVHKNNNDLERTSNPQIAAEAEKLLGYAISPSTVANWRRDWKIPTVPRGFKPPGYKGRMKKKEKSPSTSSKDIISAEGAEKDLDAIQSLLNDWVAKYRVSTMYIAYDNASWDTNWEHIEVVQRTKKYSK